MRNVVYKDKKIKYKDYLLLLDEYNAYLEKYAKLSPVFWTIDYDFSDYPTVLDTDGDDVLRPNFLQDIAKEVTAKYGDYGTDNVITLIHSDNWKSGKTATRKGIWGTNYSYKYGKYHIQYCRWDAKNPANTFGTLNHEQDHTYDALIKVELGIDINPILGVSNYDSETTHGGKPPYKYIRYKENADKLKVLSPYIKSAYTKRFEKNSEVIRGKQLTIIGLLEKLIYLYKQKQNIKNGNPQ